MSNKFILLTSLFLIFASQHNSVWAGPSEDDEDIFAYPEARLHLKDIIGDESTKQPLLSEEIQPNVVSKREDPSQNEILSDWLTASLISPELSFVMQKTEDDMLAAALAQKLVFTNVAKVTGFDIILALRDVSTDKALGKLDSTDLFLSSLDLQTTTVGTQGLVDDELAANLGTKLQFSTKPASILATFFKALKNLSPGVETYMTYETPD